MNSATLRDRNLNRGRRSNTRGRNSGSRGQASGRGSNRGRGFDRSRNDPDYDEPWNMEGVGSYVIALRRFCRSRFTAIPKYDLEPVYGGFMATVYFGPHKVMSDFSHRTGDEAKERAAYYSLVRAGIDPKIVTDPPPTECEPIPGDASLFDSELSAEFMALQEQGTPQLSTDSFPQHNTLQNNTKKPLYHVNVPLDQSTPKITSNTTDTPIRQLMDIDTKKRSLFQQQRVKNFGHSSNKSAKWKGRGFHDEGLGPLKDVSHDLQATKHESDKQIMLAKEQTYQVTPLPTHVDPPTKTTPESQKADNPSFLSSGRIDSTNPHNVSKIATVASGVKENMQTFGKRKSDKDGTKDESQDGTMKEDEEKSHPKKAKATDGNESDGGQCQTFFSAMEQLQQYCADKNLDPPAYMIMRLSGGFGASVNFKEGLAISESPSKTEDLAKEMAAESALKQLKLERITIKVKGHAEKNPTSQATNQNQEMPVEDKGHAEKISTIEAAKQNPGSPVTASLPPALDAIMKLLESTGNKGLNIGDLCRAFKYKARADMQPHLLNLQKRGLIKKASDGVQWLCCKETSYMQQDEIPLLGPENCTSNDAGKVSSASEECANAVKSQMADPTSISLSNEDRNSGSQYSHENRNVAYSSQPNSTFNKSSRRNDKGGRGSAGNNQTDMHMESSRGIERYSDSGYKRGFFEDPTKSDDSRVHSLSYGGHYDAQRGSDRRYNEFNEDEALYSDFSTSSRNVQDGSYQGRTYNRRGRGKREWKQQRPKQDVFKGQAWKYRM